MTPATDGALTLSDLRARLDEVDVRLAQLLAERARVLAQVIEFKAAHGVGPVDRQREVEMLARIERVAAGEGLDPRVARHVLEAVIAAFTMLEREQLEPET